MIPSDSPGGRLQIFLNDKKLLASDVAKKTNAHPSTVGHYLSNETEPKKAFLRQLEEVFRLNPAWVDYGIEPMYLGDDASPCRIVCEPAAPDYEKECLRLKHELADQRLALAEVEMARGKQQGMIFEAVVRACRAQGMTPEQTQAITFAVMDYEGQLDIGSVADPETDLSHRKAAGE